MAGRSGGGGGEDEEQSFKFSASFAQLMIILASLYFSKLSI